MWFTKLIKQFFFWIDKIVFNFIPAIYDLLLEIARTSILTQADIADMADRIYKLLAIFMIFKVTLSLIMYVVNPDDFHDKTKGVAKLGTNIIISLSLLILTPYIFNYAYQAQTIILEDNSLATLIFGDDLGEKGFLNTAGEEMAYITMQAFFTPNLSFGDLHECTTLYETVYEDDGSVSGKKFNTACYNSMKTLLGSGHLLENYKAGVEKSNLGLMFRQDLATATATVSNEEDFVMDYKFIFSTAVGVVIILLLISFCMDVAVRSLKLAFYQLIAPIPILSYVDPKSGKDGLFKKWYEACFKTFLSLFIRLLALYFAVYIISKVGDMQLVDIVDGSYKGGFFLSVFVIIGALMFAKQLPKILEGLGIKLDGDGKFTLNPLRKMEKEALGGGILKKPNDALAKFGKGVLKSPFTGAALGAKKLMAGVDSARNGKGFWNGTKNVKSKLAQSKDKFMEKNLPHTFQKRKDIKAGKESLALKNQMYEKGGKLYNEYDKAGKEISGAFKSSEYKRSYENVEKQKGKMYYWEQEVEKRKSALNAAEAKVSAEDTPENRKKLSEARDALSVAMTNSGKTRAQYELSKAKHDDMKKIYRDDAEIEDSRDFYMKNTGLGLKSEQVSIGSVNETTSSSSSSSSIETSSSIGTTVTTSSSGSVETSSVSSSMGTPVSTGSSGSVETSSSSRTTETTSLSSSVETSNSSGSAETSSVSSSTGTPVSTGSSGSTVTTSSSDSSGVAMPNANDVKEAELERMKREVDAKIAEFKKRIERLKELLNAERDVYRPRIISLEKSIDRYKEQKMTAPDTASLETINKDLDRAVADLEREKANLKSREEVYEKQIKELEKQIEILKNGV